MRTSLSPALVYVARPEMQFQLTARPWLSACPLSPLPLSPCPLAALRVSSVARQRAAHSAAIQMGAVSGFLGACAAECPSNSALLRDGEAWPPEWTQCADPSEMA